MLVIKYAPNIFVTSFYICFFPIPPLLQDTCVEKLENNVLKCNLFHISVFIGDGMRHSFPFFFFLCIHNLRTKYPRKKIRTHWILSKKKVRPIIYPREDNLDPRKTYEKNVGPTKARWHNGTRPTKPAKAWDPQNLAHSREC